MGEFNRVVDPFAGAGDLLAPFPNTLGYDVDPSLGWHVNDSLSSIPQPDSGDICVTNPPYLARNSATRRGIVGDDRFGGFDNLYLLALDRCLSAFDKVVAIVPETFIHSGLFRDRLAFVNIIEGKMFDDTNYPVVVAGFAKESSPDFMLYKNGKPLGSWRALASILPTQETDVRFNDPKGSLGIVCIDSTKGKAISFIEGSAISATITDKGRSITRVSGVTASRALIAECNRILDTIRTKTKDAILSPFKGNTNAGERRRRLDFTLARRIIAQAMGNISMSMAA